MKTELWKLPRRERNALVGRINRLKKDVATLTERKAELERHLRFIENTLSERTKSLALISEMLHNGA